MFPDAEQFLIDYLSPILAVPVGGKAPGNTNEFVRVIRTGGPRATLVTDAPQLTVEAYSTRGSRAWQLMEKAREAVFGLAGTVSGTTSVKAVDEIIGPRNMPDPVFASLTRYTFTAAVHMRGTPKETS